jgi:hypothetical protein
VADLASDRALADHPNVYPNPAPWKAKIVALLDQYGDEPLDRDDLVNVAVRGIGRFGIKREFIRLDRGCG